MKPDRPPRHLKIAGPKPRLLFYCQHVLGMGHFTRSVEIVRGLQAFDVFFLNGGATVAGFNLPSGVNFIDLPPLQSDAEFRDIHATTNTLDLDTVKATRTSMILDACDRIAPQIAVIELFPFGRRKFSFELIPLLDKLKSAGATIVCSLRDILVSKRDQARFETQVCEIANEYFDLILIHSDSHFQRLEDTFGLTSALRSEIRYTGFVAQEAPASRPSEGDPLIVVSIGGGRVGAELIEVAIRASSMVRVPHRMRVFAGPYMPDEGWQRVQAIAAGSPAVALERYSPLLLDYMAQADLSISMAGYNTCMNILSTGVRSLVYPFTGNNNEEQTTRARKLQDLGVISVLSADDLTPERLAARIEESLRTPRPRPLLGLDINGVARTAELLHARAKEVAA